ncbi:bacterio-opsin activator domain-containing protein [Haladaptatus cibarius]|uniref:bacterio-opsin activator domain-containing protein n=1 Tax=Haladaptatus cibarius TaxID=453847 RepID=UPI0006795799|nr:bacterio-opsin activator domain-containing protein [Haladaptatus cibarius]
MSGAENTEFLTTPEYERLRRGTETYREDLVVALAGRVGLRPSELTRICPADLTERERDGKRFYFLSVPDGDGETREAYVPPEIAHDLRKFATANDVSRYDPFVAVSPRRVQMVVSDVADRVDGLRDVTCRDLRKYFAWWSLVEEEIDPRVVQAVGGWTNLESLAPYLDRPTTTDVIDAFAHPHQQSSRDGGRPDRRHDHREHHHDRREYHHWERDREYDGRSDSRRSELLRCMGELGETLAEASTAEAVERTVCDHLSGIYRAVWICDADGSPRTTAVPERIENDVLGGVLDGIGVLEDEIPDVTIVGKAVTDDLSADGSSVGVSADTSATSSVDRASLAGTVARCSFAVAPLRSNETVHGLLCVAHDTFRPTDRTLLADVGRRVGRTITSIARKRLLLADTGVVLSLRSTDDGVFLVSASAELDCRFALEGVVPIANHSLLYFVTASGAAVGDVLDRITAADAVEDARLIRDYEDDALFEFVVSGDSLATILVERGGTVRELSAESGVLDVSGVFSEQVDVRRVVETVERSFPATDLRSKRKVSEPVRSTVDVQQSVHDRLTERQQTVLRAAYLAGYFEWPRGSTAEELAASMDVSSPTLHNHLRKAQQKVFDTVFEDDSGSSDAKRH